MLFLLGQIPDVTTGWPGWAGAGILGLVLGWLLKVHLPGILIANERRIDSLLTLATTVADKESKSRHEMLNQFHDIVVKIELDHRSDMKELHLQMRADAEADRVSFRERSRDTTDLLVAAISRQTSELRRAIAAGACKFKQTDGASPAANIENEH